MKLLESCSMVLIVSEEYQYATMSAYSPTMSEIPLNSELENHGSSSRYTDFN
jgi:hypothetical protein